VISSRGGSAIIGCYRNRLGSKLVFGGCAWIYQYMKGFDSLPKALKDGGKSHRGTGSRGQINEAVII